jgi:hypothetical protein
MSWSAWSSLCLLWRLLFNPPQFKDRIYTIPARFALPCLFLLCFVFFFVLGPLMRFLLWLLHTQRCLSASERRSLGTEFDNVRIIEQPHAWMRVFFGHAAACAIEESND